MRRRRDVRRVRKPRTAGSGCGPLAVRRNFGRLALTRLPPSFPRPPPPLKLLRPLLKVRCARVRRRVHRAPRPRQARGRSARLARRTPRVSAACDACRRVVQLRTRGACSAPVLQRRGLPAAASLCCFPLSPRSAPPLTPPRFRSAASQNEQPGHLRVAEVRNHRKFLRLRGAPTARALATTVFAQTSAAAPPPRRLPPRLGAPPPMPPARPRQPGCAARYRPGAAVLPRAHDARELTARAPLPRSILSLIGLTGAGVAVGSGVAMMSMQMEQEAAKAASAAAPAVAHSAKEARRPAARGFAASQQ